LSATATQLLYNFSAPVSPQENRFVFENTGSPTNGYLAFCNGSCASPQPPPPPGSGTAVLSTIANSNITGTYFAGTQAIGSTAILPVSVTRLGAFEYDIPVATGQTYFVDPKVAIGYSFSTGAGEPNFASVLLPAVQSDPFDVSFTYNGVAHTDTLAPLTIFDFPAGGVSPFTVTGIDPADGLDPSNTSAFATGLTFESDGTFTGIQTPITEGAVVPEPSTWAMMLLGFVGLGFAGYRKSQQRVAVSA
jgi:PEP-CTERM motif-containing protein